MSSPRQAPSQAARIAALETRLRRLETRRSTSTIEAAVNQRITSSPVLSAGIPTQLAITSLVVPNGFTRAALIAIGKVDIRWYTSNNVSAKLIVGDQDSGYSTTSGADRSGGAWGVLTIPYTAVMTGLTGGDVLSAQVVGYGYPNSTTADFASVSLQANFFRDPS